MSKNHNDKELLQRILDEFSVTNVDDANMAGLIGSDEFSVVNDKKQSFVVGINDRQYKIQFDENTAAIIKLYDIWNKHNYIADNIDNNTNFILLEQNPILQNFGEIIL